MRRGISTICSLLLVATTLLAVTPATALTYVSVPDGRLVDRAETIVRASVLSSRVERLPNGVATIYEISVERALKGENVESWLEVRVPGGVDLEKGLAVKIFGTPEFQVGERLLLFLSSAPDRGFRILHVFQGAFTARGSGDREFYERRGDDAFEVVRAAPMRNGSASSELSIRRGSSTARDSRAFERWIEDRTAGVHRSADYLLEETPRGKDDFISAFTYLADDLILRWEEFDDGGKVKWRRHTDGQAGFAGAGKKEFKKARKAWKRKFSGVPIKLTDAGTTSSDAGFSLPDGRNTILFSDLNDLIPDDFECPDGGVLAVGGISDTELFFTDWKGINALIAREGEIIMNDGIECFVGDDSKILGQIYAHELGHTLGLGHSCGDDESPKCSKSAFLSEALMRARVGVPFGPEIRDDDAMAARQIYDADFWAAACGKKVPGAKAFCSKCGPCGEGQGNCKRDSDCFGDLECTKDVGASFGFDADVNVCTAP